MDKIYIISGLAILLSFIVLIYATVRFGENPEVNSRPKSNHELDILERDMKKLDMGITPATELFQKVNVDGLVKLSSF